MSIRNTNELYYWVSQSRWYRVFAIHCKCDRFRQNS